MVFILTYKAQFLKIKTYQLDRHFYLRYVSVPFKLSMSHSKFLNPLQTCLCIEPMLTFKKLQFNIRFDQTSPVK